MNNRHTELLQILKGEGDYISGNKLSNKLGVSVRTIRNDIYFLNNDYLLDTYITSNNRLGYKVEGKMKSFKQKSYLDYNQRIFFVIKFLMDSSGWLTCQKIAERLVVSTQTINSDLIRISEFIDHQHLGVALRTKSFFGVCLEGNEIDKRLLLASFVEKSYTTEEELQHELQYLFHEWFSKKEIEETVQLFDEVSKKFKFSVNMQSWSSSIINILIQKHRLKTSLIPEHELDVDQGFQNFQEMDIAITILNEDARIKKMNIETEIQYLTLHLIGLKILLPNTKDRKTQSRYSFSTKVEEALHSLGSKYGYNFSDDDKLIKGLTTHLEKIFYPIKYHVEISNIFLNHIKSEYIQGYQMATVFSEYLNKSFSIHIPENEIGYIALHIEAALERFNNLSIQIALISTQSEIITTLIKQKIEKNIEQSQIIGIYTPEKIKNIPDEVSLIISTIPIEFDNKKTVVINEFLQSQDILHIKTKITPEVIKKNIDSEKLIYLNKQSKGSFLKTMTQKLGLEKYFKSILDRENLSSTDIGNNIAIPHPLFSADEQQSFIYIGINRKEIAWGSHPVKLVFLLILSERDKLEYEYIYREVYQLIKHNSFKIEQLIQTDNYENFIEIL